MSYIEMLGIFPDVTHLRSVIGSATLVASADRLLVYCASFSHNHERLVDCDPGDPGGKTGSTFKTIEMGKSLKKGVLECILGIFPVSGDPICRSQKCAEVTVSELSEGINISVLCSHDQRLVAHLS